MSEATELGSKSPSGLVSPPIRNLLKQEIFIINGPYSTALAAVKTVELLVSDNWWIISECGRRSKWRGATRARVGSQPSLEYTALLRKWIFPCFQQASVTDVVESELSWQTFSVVHDNESFIFAKFPERLWGSFGLIREMATLKNKAISVAAVLPDIFIFLGKKLEFSL